MSFYDTQIVRVRAVINALRRGICNHNKVVKFIPAILFSDVWWLFNLDSWFLINFADLEAQQTKNHLQQQFPVAAPAYCLEEFLQYTGLFLCLYGNGLVCLHIAGSELSDTANKAFSVSNLILEVYGCRRFTLASNKTFPNSFRPADRWTDATLAHTCARTHIH